MKKDFDARERAAYLAFYIRDGRQFKAAEVARLFGISERAVYCDFARLERVLPVYLDEDHRIKVLE